MPFRMIWGNLALMDTDAVVNAAYPTLRGGDSGVHGAICRAAGREALEAELQKTGWCDVGGAVATPGFGLRARGIIHAVAPTWRGGHDGEAALLRQTYQSALALAARQGYRSVAFPPLGADDFGFPLDVAVSVAVEAIGAYLLADGELDVALVLEAGEPLRLPIPLRGALAAYVRENAADVSPDTPFRTAFTPKTPAASQEAASRRENLPEWLRDSPAPKRSPWQAGPTDALPARPASTTPPTHPLPRDGAHSAATPPRRGMGEALGMALAAAGGLLLGLLKLLTAPLRLLARALRGFKDKLRRDGYEETSDGADEQEASRAPSVTLEQARMEDLFKAQRFGQYGERRVPEAYPARPRRPSERYGDEMPAARPFDTDSDGLVGGGPFAADRTVQADEAPLATESDSHETATPRGERPLDTPAGMPVGGETDVLHDRPAARDARALPQTDAETPAWLARRLRQSAATTAEQGPPPVSAAPPAKRPPTAVPAPIPPMDAPLPARLVNRAVPSRGIAGAARSRTLKEAMAHVGDTFSQAVLYLIDQRGMSDVEVYKRANLDRKLFSKLRSGKGYQPSKQTAVALCIALALNLDDALDLLARAGFTLAACNKADLIVAFFIEHGIYDIFQLNEALFAYGQPILGA